MPDQEEAPGRNGDNKTESERDDAAEAASAGQTSSPEETPSKEKQSFLQTEGVITIRLETLANILTAAVAIAAILLSVWEGIENRRHNRLSVMPHLESIEADISSTAPIEIEYFLVPSGVDSLHAVGYALRNSGLGPAVLEDVLTFEGKDDGLDSTPSDNVFQYFQGVRRDLDRLPFEAGLLQQPYSEGAMLKAGEVHHVATVMVPYSEVNRDTLDRSPADLVKDEVLERHSIVFCYCSVYGEDCDMAFLGAEPPAEDACGF